MVITTSRRQHSDWQHALVIGASMAGLLAARMLSDYFEQVTIVERDHLPGIAQARKGVSQGQHVHLLLNKGVNLVGDLFPNIFLSLEADGALPLDVTRDVSWFHFGAWKPQFAGSLRVYGQSRPLLEYHVRRRLTERSNVCIRDTCEVLGLVSGAKDHGGITGVRIRHHTQREEYIATNLVVDASGRGSQTPRWLTELGHPSVAETHIKIGVGYASRVYRRPETHSPQKVLIIYPQPPETKRTGYLFPIEGNAWMATLSGYVHDYPPADEAGFLAFARSLVKPDLYEAIKDAKPLSPIAIHKVPTDRWRHYERAHMPDGLIVLGDAACSFNPIYGQGMTVAALEAQLLGVCLQQQSRSGTMAGFSQRFQKALPNVLGDPWLLTTSEDLRYPEAEGKRSFGLGLLQRYTKRVFGVTATQPFATQTFYEVLNMLKPPTALFHPRILLPALFGRSSMSKGARRNARLSKGVS
ncbi:MAG: FAD-dependent oxidoreductase [Ktedonobacteraceae bacterium]|nr:FAD-dependent oxidoreductase [Ktedonobacteraceae bacterium]MBO0790717.1 FAD-dependent oxidoreductase [Ktedonobacteraceae bacterium]